MNDTTMQTMTNIEARIAAHPFARTLSEAALEVITAGARDQLFEPGEIIVRAGEPANRIYLIEWGSVGVESPKAGPGQPVLQTLGAGSTLGWSWLFPPFQWHLQARALHQTQAICLDGAHVLARCEADHEVGYELMKRVTQVLIQRLDAAVTPKPS